MTIMVFTCLIVLRVRTSLLMSDSIAGMSATVFSANILATVGESPRSGFSSLTQLYLSALYVV